MPLKPISDRLIVTLASIATLAIGAFLLALIIPGLFFHTSIPSSYLLDVQLVLFTLAMVSLFGLGPYIIYQFRQKVKLQDAINHYVKNKMQEIILALDLLEVNLEKKDSRDFSYEEKVEILRDVRATCRDVSGNLAQKILTEATKFNHNIALEKKEEARLKEVREVMDKIGE